MTASREQGPADCAGCGAPLAADARFCGACGARGAVAPAAERRRIGRFAIGPVIGRGGMGVVHRARDTDLKREVALKLISPGLAGDDDFRARFEAEARAAAAVDHPNVLPVFQAGEDDGELYLAMRLVEGTDLGAVLGAGSPLHPSRAARIVAQVAAALDAAHARNLVHRDVKPANVLITPLDDGREHVYLTDFGLTQIAGSGELTAPGQVVGTANYLAPEQISGREIDGRVDVYALACVAFELLAGEPPFARESVAATLDAHQRAPIPRVAGRTAPALPADVDSALAAGLAKQPEERFASCGALAKALGNALGTETGSFPADPRVAARARPRPSPTQPAPAPAPRAAATIPLPSGRVHERRRGGAVLTAALALLATAALVAAGVLILPALSREDGGHGGGSVRILSGAHAVNSELAALVSRLARDPTDSAEREAQSARLEAMRGKLGELAGAARRLPEAGLRSLLLASLVAQGKVLDQYGTVLRAEPAAAQAAIGRMRGTLEGVDAKLRSAAGRPAG